MRERPDWTDFYIGLAFVISQRSHDEQTQHGCIITDQNHRPLGFGYNGFPRNIDDSDLPTTRPDKYPWMFHSEENAIANCVHKPTDGIAYVTGQCCNHCLYTMWQHGIIMVYMVDTHGTHDKSVIDDKWRQEFIKRTGMGFVYVKPKLDWLILLAEKIKTN